MSCVDEEQSVFEQTALSYFKTWNSTEVKASCNYSIIMNSNTENVLRIL